MLVLILLAVAGYLVAGVAMLGVALYVDRDSIDDDDWESISMAAGFFVVAWPWALWRSWR